MLRDFTLTIGNIIEKEYGRASPSSEPAVEVTLSMLVWYVLFW